MMLERRLLAVMAVCALMAFPVAAEEGEAGSPATQRRLTELEQITVTARKTEESLQEVPVAVTALTSRDLQQSSFQTVQDVALKIPGLRWEPVPTQGNTPTITMRGMSQNDSLITLEAGIGVYFDDVFMGKLLGGQSNLMDTERIEALKGPQGTLYGKNTLGGALKIYTHKPDGTFGGYLKGTLGNYSRTDVEGAIQFPILGETLSTRIVFQSVNRDGYHEFKSSSGGIRDFPGFKSIDTSSKGDGDEQDGVSGRVTVRWAPTDQFEALGMFFATKQRMYVKAPSTLARYFPNQSQSTVAPGVGFGFPLTPFTGIFKPGCDNATVTGCDPRVISPKFDIRNLLADEDPWESYSGISTKNDLDVRFGSLVLRYDLSDNITLKSNTAWRYMWGVRNNDHDGTPFQIWEGFSDHNARQFSQEIQVDLAGLLDERLDLIAGFFYFDEDAEDDGFNNFQESSAYLQGAQIQFPGGLGPFFGEQDAQAESWSLYSQGNYSLTDRLRVTLGLRFTSEERWMVNNTLRSAGIGRVDEDYTEWTYTAGLDYQFRDGLMSYVKASSGFRSGGFDGRASDVFTAEPFDTEKLTQYEVGVKSDWFDNRLRANLALYHSAFSEIQLTNLVPCGQDVCTRRTNAGRAKIWGGELEVVTNPVEGLVLSGGLEIIDFDYLHGPLSSALASPSPEVAPPGSQLDPQNVPMMTFNLSAIYTFPPTKLGTFEAQADWFHSQDMAGSPNNADFLHQDKFGILNARVTLFDDDRGLQYSAFIRNALEREVHFSGVDFLQSSFGFGSRSWREPRTYGFEITYRFGSDAI